MSHPEWFSWSYGSVSASVRLAEVVAVKSHMGVGLVYVRGSDSLAITLEDLAELKAALGIPK